jgi:hypothetical protein
MKVNDIFCASWGHEQTNWTFFKVVKITKTMATLQKLKNKQEEIPGAMRGTVVPSDEADGKPVRRKILDYDGPMFKIESYMFARPWNGQPKQFTSYA